MSGAGGCPLSDGVADAIRQVAEVAAVVALVANQGAARHTAEQAAAPLGGGGEAGPDLGLAGAAAAARAASGEEREAAAHGFAAPDVRASPLDEHHQGVAAGIGHQEVADVAAARAAALAAAAYPRRDALSPATARPVPVQRDLRRGRSR